MNNLGESGHLTIGEKKIIEEDKREPMNCWSVSKGPYETQKGTRGHICPIGVVGLVNPVVILSQFPFSI